MKKHKIIDLVKKYKIVLLIIAGLAVIYIGYLQYMSINYHQQIIKIKKDITTINESINKIKNEVDESASSAVNSNKELDDLRTNLTNLENSITEATAKLNSIN